MTPATVDQMHRKGTMKPAHSQVGIAFVAHPDLYILRID
ncbi:hypothetical protein C4J95_2623 [Pseudomonas orientalis]|nr:hypothetical protein C4J95_2623 [Pseudomonas orientalis]